MNSLAMALAFNVKLPSTLGGSAASSNLPVIDRVTALVLLKDRLRHVPLTASRAKPRI